jgi:hypothetical protein
MRDNEEAPGTARPNTLGEYRDLCAAIGGSDCEAVAIMDRLIAKHEKGRDEIVLAPDSQMRALLYPALVIKAKLP